MIEEQLRLTSVKLDHQVHQNNLLKNQVEQINTKYLDIQQEIAQAKASLAAEQHTANLLRQQNQEIQLVLDTQSLSYQKQIKTLQDTLDAYVNQSDSLNKEIVVLRQQLQDKHTEFELLKTQKLQLDQVLDRTQLNLNGSVQQRDSYEGQLRICQEEVSKVRLENLQLSFQVQNQQTIQGQQKLSFDQQLQGELAQQQQTKQLVQHLENELDDLKRAHQDKSRQLCDFEAQVQVYKSRSEGLDLRCKSLQKQLEEVLMKVNDLENDQRQKHEFRQKIMAELDQVQEENKRLLQLNNVPTNIFVNQQISYQDFPSKLQSIVHEHNKSLKQVESLQQSLQESQNNYVFLEQRYAKVEKDLKSFEKRDMVYSLKLKSLNQALGARQQNDQWFLCMEQAIKESQSYRQIELRTKELSQQVNSPCELQEIQRLSETIAELTVENQSLKQKIDNQSHELSKQKQIIDKQNSVYEVVYNKLSSDRPLVQQKSFAEEVKALQHNYQQQLESKILEIAQLKIKLERQQHQSQPQITQIVQQPQIVQQDQLAQEMAFKLQEKEQQLVKSQFQVRNLESILKIATDNVKELENRVQQVQQQNDVLVTKDQDYKTAQAAMQQQLRRCVPSDLLDKSVQELQQCQEVNRQMTQKISQMQLQQIQINTQVDNCQIQIVNLQSQLHQAQIQKAEIQRNLNRDIEASKSNQIKPEPASQQVNVMIQQMSDWHRSELIDRESMIQQLQDFVVELEKQVKAQAVEAEAKIQSLLDQHSKQIQQTKEGQMQTQIENADLHNRIVQLQKQIEVIKDREQTLLFTGEIQSEEIQRLLDAPQQTFEVQQKQKLLALTQRIDSIQLASFEKEEKIGKLQALLDFERKDQADRRNLLETEIQQLKQQIELLKKQVDIVSSQQQQNNLLKLLNNSEASSDQALLFTQEKAARSEQQLEELRLILHKKQSQFKSLQDELNVVKFEKSKSEADLQNELAKAQIADQRLRQMDEIVDKNKQLVLENLSLQKIVNEFSNQTKELKDATKNLSEIQTQLKTCQEENLRIKENLKKNLAVFNNQRELLQKTMNELNQLKKQLNEKEEEILKRPIESNKEIEEELSQAKQALEILRKDHEALMNKKENEGKGQSEKDYKQLYQRIVHSLMRAKDIVERIHQTEIEKVEKVDVPAVGHIGQKRMRTD